MIEFDRQHIWHPYSSMTDPAPVYPVSDAHGCRLRLADGREVIDGMASWWCAIHGYNHPVLNAAITDQLQRMAHVMFGGLTHEPAVALARQLVTLTPEPLQYVFFSDSGSVAVEVAIKMALQYWDGTSQSSKCKLLALRGAYHGDTLGAMAVSDPVNGLHRGFPHVLARHFFADRPTTRFGQPMPEEDLQGVRALLEAHHHEIAAMILEPIVQGAGGMWFYSADYLKAVAQLCRSYDVLLICDEIATGFGRTGKLFGIEHASICPDILCLGKALTGGYLGLAATLCTERISEGICRNQGVLMHGPTFMANPLATRVAVSSIEVLLASPWQERVSALSAQMRRDLAPLAAHPAVADVRVLGAIGVVETHRPVPVAKVQRRLVEEGVWLRPFGRLIYLMPPYCIAAEELERLTRGIAMALDIL